MNIATRADCISMQTAELLAELAEKTVLTVELGLQTTNDITAAVINRCHTYGEFLKGYELLRSTSEKIRIGVHIINGLPKEGIADMEKTARDVAAIMPDEVKIHLLHVILIMKVTKSRKVSF